MSDPVAYLEQGQRNMYCKHHKILTFEYLKWLEVHYKFSDIMFFLRVSSSGMGTFVEQEWGETDQLYI